MRFHCDRILDAWYVPVMATVLRGPIAGCCGRPMCSPINYMMNVIHMRSNGWQYVIVIEWHVTTMLGVGDDVGDCDALLGCNMHTHLIINMQIDSYH